MEGTVMDSWITQLRKGLLEFLVLIILEDGESYGYEIVSKLKSLEGMNITESTVYPILARMKKEGFARTRTVPSSEGPPRRYYSLTFEGKVRLSFMKQYWNALHQSIENMRKGGKP
jgi:PadR family transcriptional regulator PadR